MDKAGQGRGQGQVGIDVGAGEAAFDAGVFRRVQRHAQPAGAVVVTPVHVLRRHLAEREPALMAFVGVCVFDLLSRWRDKGYVASLAALGAFLVVGAACGDELDAAEER